MSKKTKQNESGYEAEHTCSQYDCGICADKFDCDYYINTFCVPPAAGQNAYYQDPYGGYGMQQNGAPQDGTQQQPQQNNQQTFNAGYGNIAGQPIPNPNQPNGVQLSPIVIPVSFVPYTTQNQPLYQVETVMPEVEFVKHRGRALFMLVVSVAIFFIFSFPLIANYSANNILAGLFTGMPVEVPFFTNSMGFEELFKFRDMIVMISAHIIALSLLGIFVTAVYNTAKYIIKSITGRLKKGSAKSNKFIFVCILFLFAGIVVLNMSTGLGAVEAFGKVLKNDSSLVYGLNFAYYALIGASILLLFATAFIKTERYAPVEGALPE
ncbi:MAG: hypothetical protein LBQ40_07775 [Clostridiales bacterium]|jgi:hypothetical protein|nr:hypothetical protein [Clostridiales bacterium]